MKANAMIIYLFNPLIWLKHHGMNIRINHHRTVDVEEHVMDCRKKWNCYQ